MNAIICVLSVDPGETSGVVVSHLRWDTKHPGRASLEIVQTTEVRWNEWTIWKYLVEESSLVLCENFRLRPNKARQQGGSEMPTVRLIGALQCLTALDNKEFVTHEPTLKSVYPRDRLRKLGCDHPSQHVRDAMSHLLWYVLKQAKSSGAVRPDIKILKPGAQEEPE